MADRTRKIFSLFEIRDAVDTIFEELQARAPRSYKTAVIQARENIIRYLRESYAMKPTQYRKAELIDKKLVLMRPGSYSFAKLTKEGITQVSYVTSSLLDIFGFCIARIFSDDKPWSKQSASILAERFLCPVYAIKSDGSSGFLALVSQKLAEEKEIIDPIIFVISSPILADEMAKHFTRLPGQNLQWNPEPASYIVLDV